MIACKNLLPGAFDGVNDGLNVLLVGKRTHNIGLDGNDGLAVVGFAKSIGHRKHHAVATQGFFMHDAKDLTIVVIVLMQL